MAEFLAYGEWAAKGTPVHEINITKKELEKILI